MKRVHQEMGERDWSFEDLQELQSEPLKALDRVFSAFGDCVVTGCEVTDNQISRGVVCLGGRVMLFEGAVSVVFPCCLVESKTPVNALYIDGVEKPIAFTYEAIVSIGVSGDGGASIEVTSNGVESVLRQGSDRLDESSSLKFATSLAIKLLNDKVDRTRVGLEEGISDGDQVTLNTAKGYADEVVARLVDSSPDALNTLQELAAALGDDPNFSTTVINEIAKKSDKGHGHNEVYNTKTEIDTKIAQAISDIEIGGVNLIKDSLVDLVSSDYVVLSGYLKDNWVVGTTYTVTVKGVPASGRTFRFYRGFGYNFCGQLENIKNDIYSVTFVCPSNTSPHDDNVYSLYHYPDGVSSATVEWIKLERGNKSTDLSPSPDDKADVEHTHAYLPLAGGAINGDLTILNNGLTVRTDNYAPSVGGHAECLVALGKADGTIVATLGAMGGGDTFDYLYLGVGGYDSFNNLRINGNGIVSARGFLKYGSSDSYFLLGGGGHVARSSYSVASHTHDDCYYTEAEMNTKLRAKEDTIAKNSAFNKNFGATVGAVCQGNDARLSNARTPLSHNHPELCNKIGYSNENGCLVQLDVKTTEDRMIYVKITGNGYSDGNPINTDVCFYNYNTENAILCPSATHLGLNFGNIHVFNYNGYVYLWVKQTKHFQMFRFTAHTHVENTNIVKSISNLAIPDGITREQIIIPAIYAKIGHAHSYSSITGKPTTFVPSAHTHTDKMDDFKIIRGSIRGVDGQPKRGSGFTAYKSGSHYWISHGLGHINYVFIATVDSAGNVGSADNTVSEWSHGSDMVQVAMTQGNVNTHESADFNFIIMEY